jgi:formylglycine-generating enzyme required for sulfatase activity/dienelactone hydrolase/predicted Ser/Thr protein kinase
MIGRTVSHFKITRELGRGGMGIVYVARDLDLERDVALKFLPAHSTSDENAIERFVQEARAASALDHENICTIHEIGRAEDGNVFIAMAYYGGRTLREVIDGDRPDTDRALEIATQIAAGLDVAHANGIVHRDIKPANIMVTDRGQVKILDFGLAKLAASAARLTKENSTLGTVAYMSPEQLRGDDVDARSDVWALGVVLYEMLTGKLPFAGEHAAALSYAIIHETPRPVAQQRADVPPGVIRVLDRALQKDAAARFASAHEMFTALRACRSESAPRRPVLSRRWVIASAAALVVIVAALLFWQRGRNAKVEWARTVALPEIERLAADRSISGGEQSLWNAFELAGQVEKILPGEPLLDRLRPAFSRRMYFTSTPPGASVHARPYGAADSTWRDVGTTPLDVVFPQGFALLQFRREGYATATHVELNNIFASDTLAVTMHAAKEVPPGMVWIEGATSALMLPGLEGLPEERVPGFWLDRTEVSNRDFKRFVDAGGYRDPGYWREPFVESGRTLSFEEAMARFVDSTGRPGPASWEAGDYPRGADDHPVSGVSWYEAAAYAAFAGRQLPTVYHWDRAAFTVGAPVVIPMANFRGRGADPVDRGGPVHGGGALHIAGNVREWCWNASASDARYILGGGWADQPYSFNDAYAQRAFDRSLINGFRCIRVEDSAAADASLARMIMPPSRDFYAEKPVDDATFAFILKQYAYDRTALDPRMEYERDDGDWIRQKVTFNAAYGNERVIAHVFLPKGVQPPYQTVVFFPGSGDMYQRSSEELRIDQVDYIIKSGRAVVYPVYYGMLERGGTVATDQPSESVAYRDWVIALGRDLSRTLDYLETREDVDAGRLAYYGLSMGGRMAPIMLAIEPRFQAAVLYVAGLKLQRALPEADAINFVTRVKLPVLMINARYDFFFPLETSQRPLFDLLGTPATDKKWVVYDGGHSVPRSKLIAELLAWLDARLGPVGRATN